MKDQSLRNLMAGFPGRRILILGDVMLDEYIWGDVKRISPEAPVPVVNIHRRTHVPGGAGNTAANVASLDGVALLASVVGRDYQAEELISALNSCGVEANGLVKDPDRLTTTKTRIVAHNQQVVRVDCERTTAISASLEDALLQWMESQLKEVSACVLSDYAKGVVSARMAERYIRLARSAGKPVVVDPKGTDYSKYRGATLVKPNLHEAERASKLEITGETSLLEVGQRLSTILEGAALLITRGAEGMTLFRSGSPPVHIPTVARNVYDVTGAGDTVISTLALSLAAGGTLEQAAQLANMAAGIAVGKVGTAMVKREELLAEVN